MSDRITQIHLGPMELDDVDQVVAIDRQSFPLPWSASSYRRELAENENSHFIVAYRPDAESDPARWWARWLQPAPARPIVGYAGYWRVADEAHISTIAVHPDYRRRRVGERLVAALLRHARQGGATLATLEVRVSNLAAQRLYHKYGFVEMGRRKGYYRDNREDALLMTLEPIARAAPHIERWEALAALDGPAPIAGGAGR